MSGERLMAGAQSALGSAQELDQVSAVVVELQAMVRDATVALSLRIGELVTRRFLDGNAEGWRDRGGLSLRRLARHPELPLSASALYRCIALYELRQRVGALNQYPRLGTSHFRAVFGLPLHSQKELLELADRQQWTVAAIEREAAKCRGANNARGGRPRLPALVRVMRGLKPLAEHPGWAASGELESLSELELQELTLLAERARKALDGLQDSLQNTITARGKTR